MSDRYHTPLTPGWFLERAGYRRFMAREATSIAVALYLLYLLRCLHLLGQDEAGFETVRVMAGRPVTIVFHAVMFGAILYHAVTWFNLTPKIMPLYVAEEKVPDFWAAILMGYLPWVVITLVVLWGCLP